MKRFFVIILSILSLNLCFAQSQQRENLKKDVYYLSSDALEGREVGSIGSSLAREYICSQLNQANVSHYVQEGSEIFVEKLTAEEGNTVEFNQVLMLDKKVGSPYLTGVTVEGEVLKNGKAKKIKVFKYKQKDKSNRKTQGHRQPYTKIKITKINA